MERSSIVDNSRSINWRLLKSIRFFSFGFYNRNSPSCSHCSPMEPITPVDQTHHSTDAGKTTTCEHLVVATPIDLNNPQMGNNKTGSQLSLSAETKKCSECSGKATHVKQGQSVQEANQWTQVIDGSKMTQDKRLATMMKQPQASKQQPPIHIIVEPVNDDSVRCDCRHCQFFSGWCCMPCSILIIVIIIIVWITTKWARSSGDDHHDEIRNATTTTPNITNTFPAYETIIEY